MWAAQNNIVSGVGGGLFNPSGLITRQQVAAILYKYAQYKGKASEQKDLTVLQSYSDQKQISEYAKPAMAWAVNAGLLKGVTATTLQPQGTCPRSQCATIMSAFDDIIRTEGTPTPEPSPSEEPEESVSPSPSEEPEPSESSALSESAEPSETPAPSESPVTE